MNLNLTLNKICDVLNLENPVKDSQERITIRHIAIDSRSPRINESTLFVALKGNKSDGHNHLKEISDKGVRLAIVARPIVAENLIQLVVEHPLKALQKLATAHRAKFAYPVIAITGSNGKTIVKEWLYHVLKDDFNIVRSPKSYNSQLGVALSVLEMTAHHSLAIFEAGISEPGEMDILEGIIQPTAGIFTGIGDAHDANFESKSAKRDEKYKLFKRTKWLIEADALHTFNSVVPFSDKASFANASTVFETALKLGLNKEDIDQKLKTLPAVSMRLEQMQGQNNCLLINDAYTADLTALEIGLAHLNQIAGVKSKVLVLGLSSHQFGLTEKDVLHDILSTAKLDRIIFIGEQNKQLQTDLAHELLPSAAAFLEANIVFENAVILFKGAREFNLEKLVGHYAEKKHVTQLMVNLAGMRHNLNFFRNELEKGCKTLVMVKAQSYGTGMVEIAQFLQNESVDYLGVAYADEGVELRKAGIHLPILVMNPERVAFEDIVKYDLEPSIYSFQILQSFLHHLILKQIQGFPVHIKLDTGMNRLGFGELDIKELIETLQSQPEVHVKSVFSHLAVADELNEQTFTFNQIRRFEIMSGKLKELIPYHFDRHLANSSGTLNFKTAHHDMIRIGIGLYGLIEDAKNRLENVLTFNTEISQIKLLEAGDSLGYGRKFVAGELTKVAIIPVGYADGLRRALGQGNWYMMVNGERAEVIGTVCMDMCMLDITNIAATVGDQVQIFGQENSIFEMAKHLYTIPYEIISSISSRVHRVYLD